jgi:hypothetical protein
MTMNAPDPSLDGIIASKRETVGAGAENGHAPARRAADWLCLAAAPTFAIMALLTGVFGGAPDMLCSTAQGGLPLDGMVPMYVLMSAFHSAPWLRLFCSRSRRNARSCTRVNSPAG